tara:strand:- start:1506 stop:1655 length:150 start_codon:yes stop_codon:yes gene_type:complete
MDITESANPLVQQQHKQDTKIHNGNPKWNPMGLYRKVVKHITPSDGDYI